jgi:hypothetical protein
VTSRSPAPRRLTSPPPVMLPRAWVSRPAEAVIASGPPAASTASASTTSPVALAAVIAPPDCSRTVVRARP